MSEKCQSVIELHEVPAGIMDVLLDFVYTETVNVSVENVQELLPAACLLQLTGKCVHSDGQCRKRPGTSTGRVSPPTDR
jgi:hypothetical protein